MAVDWSSHMQKHAPPAGRDHARKGPRMARARRGELTPRERQRLTTARKKASKGTHGGKREGAGRPALFRDKGPMPHSILLTTEAKAILDAAVERTGASRNDVMEALLRRCGDDLTAAMIRRMPGASND